MLVRTKKGVSKGAKPQLWVQNPNYRVQNPNYGGSKPQLSVHWSSTLEQDIGTIITNNCASRWERLDTRAC